MAGWARANLTASGRQEPRLQSESANGTQSDPVTMWLARVEDGIHVGSVNGREGGWFRGTQTRKQGRIGAGSVSRDVRFFDAGPGVLGAVEAAYRTKYAAYPDILERSISPQLRAAVLEVVPR